MVRISQTAPVRAIRNLPSNVCYGVGKVGKGIFNIVKGALLGVAYVFASIVTAPYKLTGYLASKVSKKVPASAAKTQLVRKEFIGSEAAQVLPTKAADTTASVTTRVPILPGVPTPIISPASQEEAVEATEVTPPTTPLNTPPASPSAEASDMINSLVAALKGVMKAKWNALSPEIKEKIKAALAESYEAIVHVEQPPRGLRRPASPQAIAARQLQVQLLVAIKQAPYHKPSSAIN